MILQNLINSISFVLSLLFSFGKEMWKIERKRQMKYIKDFIKFLSSEIIIQVLDFHKNKGK